MSLPDSKVDVLYVLVEVRDLVARTYFIPAGASQRVRGWVVGRRRSVSHVDRRRQGSGFDGWARLDPVGSQESTSGSHMVPYGSKLYTDTGQSSDPSGLVGSHRAISGSDWFP